MTMGNQAIAESQHQMLDELIREYMDATALTRPEKVQKIMGQVDLMADSKEGLERLFELIPKLTEAGIFKDSPWADASKLVPTLVNGTLKSGHPNSTIEILSELRLLAVAKGKLVLEEITETESANFIQEVVVSNLEFVFNEPQEETRLVMSEHELSKVHSLFKFLSFHTDFDQVKAKIAEELHLICEQRPVVTEKQRRIIAWVKEKIELNPDSQEDEKLLSFQRSIYRPSKRCEGKDFKSYRELLSTLSEDELKEESEEISGMMLKHGLVSQFQASLLLHLVENDYQHIVPICLGLNPTGLARFNEMPSYVLNLIKEIIDPFNAQCIYGLSKMLENGILSREAVRSGLSNLLSIKIHTEVEKRILKSTRTPHEKVSPRQYLIGSVLRILGQPLGVGQGNNPTCQSARGISMWSQHAPAKLIHMIQTAAVYDDLTFRFEGKEIKYSTTPQGLVQALDHNLDAVSVTLVPMLDRIYNEMMRLATGRGEDPHKWVNPALYGQWIQVGFASAYDYMSDAIIDFDGFVRVFYAMCHPSYNGGNRLVYPNPVGIFITSAKAEMLGFHAVSLLRVDEDPKGELRAYFLNPNNEGRQDWGQDIKPSVVGKGEVYGESSLPLYQFAARVYAFHFNTLDATEKMINVPEEEVQKVKKLARESWGQSYNWLDIRKKW